MDSWTQLDPCATCQTTRYRIHDGSATCENGHDLQVFPLFVSSYHVPCNSCLRIILRLLTIMMIMRAVVPVVL